MTELNNKNLIISQLSRALFWDVAYDELDMDSNASFIIARVLDRGTKNDVRLIQAYYTVHQIREALMGASGLGKKQSRILLLCSGWIDVNSEHTKGSVPCIHGITDYVHEPRSTRTYEGFGIADA